MYRFIFPQTFELIDDLLVLHRGQTVFTGPTSDAINYFRTSLALEITAERCPADVIFDELHSADLRASSKQSVHIDSTETPSDRFEMNSAMDEWEAIFESSVHRQFIREKILGLSDRPLYGLTAKYQRKGKTHFHELGYFILSIFVLCRVSFNLITLLEAGSHFFHFIEVFYKPDTKPILLVSNYSRFH